MLRCANRWLPPSENMRLVEGNLEAADAAYAAAVIAYKAALRVRGDVLLQARETLKRANQNRWNCRIRLAKAKKTLRPDIPPAITRLLTLGESYPPEVCIEWDGNTNRNGYGLAYFLGRRQLAHRLAYVIAHGIKVEDLKGVVIRHRCDNPRCVRPEHLLPGTQADNVRDMYERGRAVPGVSRGSASGTAKLKESDIPAIRARIAAGERRRDIAADYGVTKNTINRIQRRESWAHV